MAAISLDADENVTVVASAAAIKDVVLAFAGAASGSKTAAGLTMSLAAASALTVDVTPDAPATVDWYLEHSGSVTGSLITATLNAAPGIAAIAPAGATHAADLVVNSNFISAPTQLVESDETASLGLIRDLDAVALPVEAIPTAEAGVSLVLFTNPVIPVEAAANACLDPGRSALGACDVIREILVLWGMDDLSITPGHAKRRALHDLNAALQEIWNQAKDRNYWTRSTLDVAFAEGASTYDLSDLVQNVIGPARTSAGRPLVPLGSRGELDNCDDLYMDDRDAERYPVSTPSFFYVERLNQTGKDPAKCILHIWPAAPAGGTSVKLDVVLEAPRFTWSDVEVCNVVPIPHRYVESLLLPIVRYKAKSHYLFVATEQIPAIDEAYAMAKAQLESADPLPGKSGDNTNLKEDPRV